jgi:hypothetical protein
LIEGPKSKSEWKEEAILQLLQAAQNLKNSRPENEEGESWVVVLLCYPNLWSSEVTVFFDKEYLNSFIPSELGDQSILKKYCISCPKESSKLITSLSGVTKAKTGNQ